MEQQGIVFCPVRSFVEQVDSLKIAPRLHESQSTHFDCLESRIDRATHQT